MKAGTANGEGLVSVIDRCFYKDFQDHWDDKIFRNRIMRYVDRQKIVLDLGAGAGRIKEMNFKGLAKAVYGLDPDERIMSNPLLDKAYVGCGNNMPFFDYEQFDVVFANNVLEHIHKEESNAFCREVYRILKPGGIFLAKTPNRFHYVSVVSRITPTKFHKIFNRIKGRQEADTFRTYYGLNTKKAQISSASRTGFRAKSIEFIEGRPEYLRATRFAYPVGVLYERFVNRLSLDALKVIIISSFEKESGQKDGGRARSISDNVTG